jgi:hypothetical protein
MASQGAIKAGRAYVELFADSSRLAAGLKHAEAQLRKFGESATKIGKSVMMAGTAMLAPFAASVKIFSSMGDNLAKMSKRTGFAVETLSELKFAAERSGASIEVLEVATKKMQKTISDAANGSASAADALGRLGLSAAELQALSPEQQFLTIASALAEVQDATERAALSQLVFSEQGTKLLPMLEGGADGLAALRKEAHTMGLVVSGEAAAAAEVLTDKMGDAWAQIKMAAFQIGAALAPAVIEASTAIRQAVQDFTAWVQRNEEAIVAAAKFAAAILALGAGIYTLGKLAGAFAMVVKAVNGLRVALSFLAAHPVIAALAAITIAVAAVAAAYSSAQVEVAKLSSAKSELLAQGERERDEDAKRLSRLEELSKAQKLTTEQMAEAEKLIASLTSKYGSLGISIDKATGRLIGFAGAASAVNAAMRKAMMGELQAEGMEQTANMRALKREFAKRILLQRRNQSLETNAADVLGPDVESMSLDEIMARAQKQSFSGNLRMNDPERMAAIRAELASQQVRFRANRERYNAMAADGAGGAAPGAAGGAAGDAFAREQERLEKRATELRIASIEDRRRREMAALDAKYAEEEARIRGIEATEEQKAQLIRQLDQQAAEERRQMQAGFDAEVAKTAKEQREQIDADRFAAMEEQSGLQRQLADDAARLADEQAEAELRAKFKGAELETRLLERNREKEIKAVRDRYADAAKRDAVLRGLTGQGLTAGDLDVDAAVRAVNARFDAQRGLIGAADDITTPGGSASARGLFNAFGLQGLQGDMVDIPREQLEVGKQQLAVLKMTFREIEDGALALGP